MKYSLDIMFKFEILARGSADLSEKILYIH